MLILTLVMAAPALVAQATPEPEWMPDLPDPMLDRDWPRFRELMVDVLQLTPVSQSQPDYPKQLVAGLEVRLKALAGNARSAPRKVVETKEDLAIALLRFSMRQRARPYLEQALEWRQRNDAPGSEGSTLAALRLAGTIEPVASAIAAYRHEIPKIHDVQLKADVLEHAGALGLDGGLAGPEQDYLAAAALRTQLGKCVGAHAHAVLGALYQSAKRHTEAIAMFDKVEKCRPSTRNRQKLSGMVKVSCGQGLGLGAELDAGALMIAQLLAPNQAGATEPEVIAGAAKFADLMTELAAPSGDFGELRSYLQQQTPTIASLLLSRCRDPQCFPGAYEVMLHSKGLLAQALRPGLAITELGRNPEASEILARAKRQGLTTPEKWAISAELVPLLGLMDDPKPSGLSETIMPGEAFLDYYRYTAVQGCRLGENRFGAVLSLPARPPAFIDLGTEEAAEAMIQKWEDRVKQNSNQAKASLAELAAQLWAPIIRKIPAGTSKLWVSPDGALNRIAFNAFAAGAPHQVAIINSAQQLKESRQRERPAAGQKPSVLVVGPFEYGPAASEGNFTAIDEAASEAGAVQGQWEKSGASVTRCHGQDGRASVLDAMRRSGVIHFSTHARVAEDDNALTRSGLALHGANAGGDGLLTPADIAGLDLQRVTLVALASCKSARGEIVEGQGTIGFQAAFMAAGSRTLLMSLQDVAWDDAKEFFLEFYSNLMKSGHNAPALALRKTQEYFSARPGSAWMPWVLVGQGW